MRKFNSYKMNNKCIVCKSVFSDVEKLIKHFDSAVKSECEYIYKKYERGRASIEKYCG